MSSINRQSRTDRLVSKQSGLGTLDANYIPFDPDNGIWKTQLDEELYRSKAKFENLWDLHPDDFPSIFLHGRQVNLPRWQKAYGMNYFFSNNLSKAEPVPSSLKPYLSWAKMNIDQRLNGMLLNWYDHQLGHYIGAHRDSTQGLYEDSIIVMISLGGARVMRFRPMNKKAYVDIELNNGDAVVMPLYTNLNYKHEVPKFKRFQHRRISITIRCFK